MGKLRTSARAQRATSRAAAAGIGLALAAGGLLVAPSASAAVALTVSPGSGPVGTAINVSGSCGDAPTGRWTAPAVKLYFPDAADDPMFGPSAFAEGKASISGDDYSGSVTVPASGEYLPEGAAKPVTRAVKGTIRVLVQCFTTTVPAPYHSGQQSAPFVVAGSAKTIKAVKKPVIKGKAKVGKKLKAKPGTWSPAATSYAYQWYRGKAAITGATARVYRVVRADAAKKLKVTVTATRAGYAPASATSKAIKIKKRR